MSYNAEPIQPSSNAQSSLTDKALSDKTSKGQSLAACSAILKPGIELTQLTREKFRLTVLVSDAQLANIHDAFKTLEGISSIALAKVLKDEVNPKLFRFCTSFKKPIQEAFPLKGNHRIPDAQRAMRLVSAIGSFMRGGTRHSLQATDLYISVRSPSGESINGKPCESNVLTKLRERFLAAVSAGPWKDKELEWEEKKDCAQALLDQVEKAFQLHSQGYPNLHIAHRIKRTEESVSACLQGNFTFALDELEAATRADIKHAKIHLIPRSPSLAWAAVTGAYSAITMHGGFEDRIVISTNSEERIRSVQEAFRALELGLEATISQVKRSPDRAFWACFVQSKPLAETLADITASGTKVPWVMLGTPEEKLAFLRKYFLLRGNVSNSAFSLSSKRFEVIVGIVSLLQEFQIIPATQVKSDGSLLVRIYSPCGLKRALDLNLFSIEDIPKIQKLLEGVDVSRQPEVQFKKVLEYRQYHPNATYQEVSDACQVSPSVCYNWLSGTRKPYAVRALESIAELRAMCHIPFPEVASFLYRKHNFSDKAATVVAEKVTLHQVKSAICQSEFSFENARSNPEYLIRLAKSFMP